MTIDHAEALARGPSIAARLREHAAAYPARPYAVEQGRTTTLAELDALVDRIAEALSAAGVDGSARVAISLPTTVLHAAAIFAVLRRGALWVPMNLQLKGAPLEHLMADSGASHLIAASESAIVTSVEEVRRSRHGASLDGGRVIPDPTGVDARIWRIDDGIALDPVPDTSVLMYTSGTTGPPKGVRVSETMLRASAVGAIHVTDVRPGDVLYVWEPLFHIGGAQMLLVPLYSDSHLALAPRFSASRFWDDVCRVGATHVHYLGGILQILLQLPDSEAERRHGVRIAWGAGATPALWAACEQRFGFSLHECYGMTETSSIVAVNRGEREGGIGRPVPWFDVRLDGQAEPSAGTDAEIVVRGRIPGLTTAGYLGNDEATSKARDGEWFRTGDHGAWDESGRLHFRGRASDSVRVRGENVSAWQVEDVFGQHPDVDRCAVVGVSADVGEEEMLLLLTAADGRVLDPEAVRAWGVDRMARFQVPRYVKLIDEMPLTPSQRIAKHRLPTGLDDAIDCAVRVR